MGRIRKRSGLSHVAIGGRIRLRCNMTWSGVVVPIDTVGTVYVDPAVPGGRNRCVRWDGFPLLQGNGFAFGIGGSPEKTFVPEWAEVI